MRDLSWDDIAKVNAEMETVPIKGNDYALVKERVVALRKLYPDAEVKNEIVHYSEDDICMQVTIWVDGKQLGCGTAEEQKSNGFINGTSYVENCETSALGRAIASMGINYGSSYASAEEVANANINHKRDFSPEEKRGAILGLVKTINEFAPYWWENCQDTFSFTDLEKVDTKTLDLIGKAARNKILSMEELQNE